MSMGTISALSYVDVVSYRVTIQDTNVAASARLGEQKADLITEGNQ